MPETPVLPDLTPNAHSWSRSWVADDPSSDLSDPGSDPHQPNPTPKQLTLPEVSPSGGVRPGARPIPLYARSQLGSVMARVMENSGTHQAEIARRLRMRPQSLNQYMKGRRVNPTIEWFLNFLRANDAVLVITFPGNFSYRSVELAAEREGRPVGTALTREDRAARFASRSDPSAIPSGSERVGADPSSDPRSGSSLGTEIGSL